MYLSFPMKMYMRQKYLELFTCLFFIIYVQYQSGLYIVILMGSFLHVICGRASALPGFLLNMQNEVCLWWTKPGVCLN